MPEHYLRPLLAPRSVALVGATEREGTLGAIVYRNLAAGGLRGALYAVNPKHREIFGQRAYARLTDLPRPPDLAVIVTPAHTVPGIVEDAAAAGVRAAVVLTSGFGETGAEGRALQEEVLKAAKHGRRAHPRSQLPRRDAHRLRPERHLRAHAGASRKARAGLAIGRDLRRDPRLGARRAARLLERGVARRRDRRRFRRGARLSRRRCGERRDPALRRRHPRRAPLRIGAARRLAREAGDRAQGRPPRERLARRVQPHRRARRQRRGVRRRATPRGRGARQDLYAAVRRGARARERPAHRGRAARDRDQRRRPGRDRRRQRRRQRGASRNAFGKHHLSVLDEELPAQWSHANPIDIIGDAPPERFAAAHGRRARRSGRRRAARDVLAGRGDRAGGRGARTSPMRRAAAASRCSRRGSATSTRARAAPASSRRAFPTSIRRRTRSRRFHSCAPIAATRRS